jgi:hypothetical protein
VHRRSRQRGGGEAGLKARIAAGAQAATGLREVREYVAAAAGDAWYAADREQLLATLRRNGARRQSAPARRWRPRCRPPPRCLRPRPLRPPARDPRCRCRPADDQPASGPRRAARRRRRRAVGRGHHRLPRCGPRAPGCRRPVLGRSPRELCARSGMIGVAEQRLSGGGLTSAQEANVRQVVVAARRRYGLPPGRPATAPERRPLARASGSPCTPRSRPGSRPGGRAAHARAEALRR